MHPDFPPDSAPLEIDRVEWVPASREAVHVHLLGRWVDRPVAEPLVLLVGTERGRRAFEALAEPPAGVLAAFAVPNELRARLGVDVALQIGAHELALPGAETGTVREPGPVPVPEEPEAEVIDRAVLAERRARRAEMAEEALQRRAAEAEQAVGTLEAQLVNLEGLLGQARDERDELQAAVSDAERRLKAAQQREYAEQQGRIEAQDEVEEVRRRQEHETADLRRRLEAADQRAEDMAREVDRARRAIAEAAQRSEADRAAVRRLEEQLAQRNERVLAGEAGFEQREELERSLGDVMALAGELRTALATEQDARSRAEAAVVAERDRAAAKVAVLEDELGRRAAVQTEIVEQLREVLAELDVVRARSLEQQANAQSMLELSEMADRLKDRVVALEGRKEAAEAELARARAELQRSEREAETLRGEAEALRGENERRREALERSQATIDALRRSAGEVDAELREAFTAEREAFAEQVAAVERHLRGLREQVADAAGQLRDALDAERAAREAAERELAEERGRSGDVRRLVAEVLATAAELREAFEEESRKLEGELTAVVVEERRRMAEELAAIESRAGELRAEVEPEPEPEVVPTVAEPAAEESAAEEPAAEEPGEARGLIADLEEAAQRLREQAVPVEDDDAEPDGAGEVAILAPRLVSAAQRPAAPWLAPAIERLARTDALTAARIVVALLPVQRLLVAKDTSYDVTVAELGTFRVQLRGAATTVEPRPAPGPRHEVDLRVEGAAAALAAFAAGGLRHPPGGTRFEGRRRRLRRLLKALREPIHLPDVARSGAAIEPGLVLALLVAGIDPGWTTGHAFTVTWDVSGPRGGTSTVRVADGAVSVEPGAPADGATATVHVPQAVFLPLLAGFAPPPGQHATTTGDAHAVALLRRWFDAAQGLA